MDKITNTANIDLSLAYLGFSMVAINIDVSLCNLDLENRINYTFIEVLNGNRERERERNKDKKKGSALKASSSIQEESDQDNDADDDDDLSFFVKRFN